VENNPTINRIPNHSAAMRILTYNVHGSVNSQRQTNPATIAEIIGGIGADYIALQEVDAEKPFTKNVNQARIIGESIGMNYIFYPVENTGLHTFGLAVLSRCPAKQSTFMPLPNLYPGLGMRKRGVMRAVFQTPHGTFHLINTHLSVYKLERTIQLKFLFRWLGLSASPSNEAIILCGDLNAGPSSLVYDTCSRVLNDVQCAFGPSRLPQSTFHAKRPVFRIDHIFVSDHFTPIGADVVRNPQTVEASDHLPLTADLIYNPLSSLHENQINR
jgi:endonuclease/exonuclease/phosphatase family metal-dependent hydrolase